LKKGQNKRVGQDVSALEHEQNDVKMLILKEMIIFGHFATSYLY
jgi:hypothetical protein